MPVQVFAHYRGWYDELRRELRLLALNHGGDYPVASELSELTLQVEQERRQASGVDRLDAAIAAGAGPGRPRVPRPGDGAGARWAGCASCSSRSTSSAASSGCSPSSRNPQQLALRNWYLGEFDRARPRGEAADAVAGSYAVEDPPR